MDDVKNRVAIIAGVPDELCGAVGIRLARGGAKVVLAGNDSSKVASAASIMKKDGKEALKLIGDLTNADDVKKMVSEVISKFGKIDILINDADDPVGGGIAEVSYGDWKKSLSNNLDPMFLFSSEIIPGMRRKKYGRVINIISIDYMGWPGKFNYCTAKSAVFGLTRSLALELAKDNITVNSLVKGDMAYPGISEEEIAKTVERVPVQRLGTPEDVAYTAAFFASDTSKYITGQTLFVCGGRSIHSSMSI